MALSKKTADLCILFLSLILIGIQAVDLSQQMYVGISGYGFSEDPQRSYTNIATPTQCGVTCLTFNCSAFTYNKVTKECRIRSRHFCSSVGATTVSARASKYYKGNAAKSIQALINKQTNPNWSRCEDINPMFGNGVYKVYPSKGQSRPYFCYRGVDNKFWNVIQYRYDGSLGFNRTWDDYKNGFGSVTQEFWLGNDEIHRLTVGGDAMLRIEMEDFSCSKTYAQYNTFYVDNEQGNYKLTIGSYIGTAGDSFWFQNGMYFTTRDRDNDNYELNCAQRYFAGYWYDKCYYNNLNGRYKASLPSMSWEASGVPDTAMRISRMMVRKK